MNKSTVEEIRDRFNSDVERFSNLELGQVSTMDAQYCMDLVARVAASLRPQASDVLDIGCGAGNYSLKLQHHLNPLNFTLVDLSLPMLDRAKERLENAMVASVVCIQNDVRKIQLKQGKYDIILATAVLHHLRSENEWKSLVIELFNALKPGGALIVFDLVLDELEAINKISWDTYAKYLDDLGGKEYQEKVFAYIEKEDTPVSLSFQLRIMEQCGFTAVDVLHKHACFAAYAAIK